MRVRFGKGDQTTLRRGRRMELSTARKPARIVVVDRQE